MSANLVVDIGQTCQFHPSIVTPTSGGTVVGLPIDLKNSNTFCNVFAAAGAGSGPVAILIQTADAVASGLFTSGAGLPLSGSFTDPTSGLDASTLPPNINSGGILWINSGLYTMPGGGINPIESGQSYLVNGFPPGTTPQGVHPIQHGQGAGGFNATSGAAPIFGSGGGVAFGAFLRPHRWARLIRLSGGSLPGASLIAGFVSQLKTTGSGGGYNYSPTSGSVLV